MRLVSYFFPPFALISVKGKLTGAPEGYKNGLDSEIKKIPDDNAEIAFDWAKYIYASEVSRKEAIEGKAQSYFTSLSIVTGIIAIIPVLFSDRWSLPLWAGIAAAILFTLAIVFISSAAYYALKTRQVGQMYLPGADLFSEQLRKDELGFKNNATQLIYFAKNNERLLTEKANYLYVSEQCFVRAIAVLLISVLFAVGAQFYQSFGSRQTPKFSAIQQQVEINRNEIVGMQLSLSRTREQLADLKGKCNGLDRRLEAIRNTIAGCYSGLSHGSEGAGSTKPRSP